MARKKNKLNLNEVEKKEFKKLCDEFLRECNRQRYDEYYIEMRELCSEAKKRISETDWLEQVEEENKEYFIEATAIFYPELLGTTPSKEKLKWAKNKGAKSKYISGNSTEKSLRLLGRFICHQYNRVYNSRFSFNYAGNFLYVMDLVAQVEHRFMLFDTASIYDKRSLFTAFKDVFDFQKAFEENMDFDKGFFQTNRFKNVMDPPWVQRGDSNVAEMYLADGGFVNHGTYKKFDCVPAMLCRNEFVLSQESVRGLGKGSYKRGAVFLYALMSHFEKEAKDYPHER